VYSTGTFCSIFYFWGRGIVFSSSLRSETPSQRTCCRRLRGSARLIRRGGSACSWSSSLRWALFTVVSSLARPLPGGQHAPAVTATIPTRYLPLGAEAPLTGRVVMDPMIWGVSLPCTVWQCGKADNAPYTPRRCRGRRSSLPPPAQPLYSLHQRWPCRACTRMVQLKALTNTPRKHHFVCIACVRHRCVRYL
jgi:hypothetical protein